jgi:rhodanese-related sulfurtransferase
MEAPGMTSLYFGISLILIIIVFRVITRKKNASEVSASTAAEMIKDPELIILDVRTSHEFSQGHIEGARLFPVAELNEKINELKDFKNGSILIYCLRGNRSRTAYQILKNNGFTNLKNLQGGIMAWIKAGNKVIGD